MKKRLLTLLSISCFLIGCAKPNKKPSEPSEDKDNLVEVSMHSHFGVTGYKDKCVYDDGWFLQNSSGLNYDLALMSAMASGAAYADGSDTNGTKIANLLGQIGFNNIQKNTYYSEGIRLEDSMGVIVGNKTIADSSGKQYTLLAVLPRSAGYGAEWMGNFNMGKEGIHAGFLMARDEILRFVKKYINTNNISGDIKVWSAGYSRGAAAANLFGGYLAEDASYLGSGVNLTPNDLYVYTIGTPRTIPDNLKKVVTLSVSGPRGEGFFDTDVPAYTYQGADDSIILGGDQYKGIHNFVATGDYVTKLPPTNWTFTRYGATETINYGDEKMIHYLEEITPVTARSFDEKTYSTEMAIKTFDLEKFEMVEGNEKISTDMLIQQRLDALMMLTSTRADFVEKGYTDVLGALTAVYGTDWDGFYDGIMSSYGPLIKAFLLNYVAFTNERLELSDSEAMAKVFIELMSLIGKPVEDPENYTDQDFLKDLLDFLFNDYQTDAVAQARAKKIADMIPAPYGVIYLNALNYAKDHNMNIDSADALIALVANYIHDNKDNLLVKALIAAFAGVFPSEYISFIGAITGKTYKVEDYESELEMKKTAIVDAFDCLAVGKHDGESDTSPEEIRSSVLALAAMYLQFMAGVPNLANILVHGSFDGTAKRESTPVKLDILCGDIIKLIAPKDADNNPLPLKEAANQSLIELLDKGRTELNGKFVDILKDKPEQLRKALFTVLVYPEAEFSLTKELRNAITLIDRIQFFAPAHYHELYICFLKAEVDSRKN